MMKTATTWLVPAVLAALLTGCSAFSKDYPDKRYFSLKVQRTGAKDPSVGDLTLKVRQLDVSRSYEGQELVYRQDNLEWAADFYNVFFVPPADLLTEATIHWMADSGLFAEAVPQTSLLQTTHYLEGYLSSLYGDYSDPANRRAVVEIGFLLIDERQPGTQVAYQGSFHREVPLADDSVETLIRAYEMAITGIMTEFEADLGKTLE